MHQDWCNRLTKDKLRIKGSITCRLLRSNFCRAHCMCVDMFLDNLIVLVDPSSASIFLFSISSIVSNLFCLYIFHLLKSGKAEGYIRWTVRRKTHGLFSRSRRKYTGDYFWNFFMIPVSDSRPSWYESDDMSLWAKMEEIWLSMQILQLHSVWARFRYANHYVFAPCKSARSCEEQSLPDSVCCLRPEIGITTH